MSGALADLLVVLHLAFVTFVVAGGFLLARWPKLVWLHLPAAAWGAGIELAGGICPLTPLENALRVQAGEVGYAGGFVEHYLLPVLYPEQLTRTDQVLLGGVVIAINMVVYTWAYRARRGRA
ncbi:MAG: DUF2784 domain-containing protein [Thiobacillus sp.]